jgi:hypothetical protein
MKFSLISIKLNRNIYIVMEISGALAIPCDSSHHIVDRYTVGVNDKGIPLYFTFTLPCIVIDFFLNNQPDALIIPILFCYKTLHVSGTFSALHQGFSTVHSALVSFMQVSDDRFQAESGWNLRHRTFRHLRTAGR